MHRSELKEHYSMISSDSEQTFEKDNIIAECICKPLFTIRFYRGRLSKLINNCLKKLRTPKSDFFLFRSSSGQVIRNTFFSGFIDWL